MLEPGAQDFSSFRQLAQLGRSNQQISSQQSNRLQGLNNFTRPTQPNWLSGANNATRQLGATRQIPNQFGKSLGSNDNQ